MTVSLNSDVHATVAYDMFTYLQIKSQREATGRSDEIIEIFENNLAYFNRLMLSAYDENKIRGIMSRIESIIDIEEELCFIEERIKKELPNLFINLEPLRPKMLL
jgi:hypothetical protein